MDDLISRQAAIDAIDKYSVWVTYTQGDSQKDEAEFVENIIKQTKKAIQSMLIEDLPSAQPIQTASNYLQSLPTSPLLVGKMPSAQPEIIRCKDCRHFEYDHPYIIQGIPVLGHEVCNAWGDGCKTDENGYCFMAERRTDE